jgi:hypothetical protein
MELAPVHPDIHLPYPHFFLKLVQHADQVGTSSVALHQQLFTEHSSDPEGSISLSLTYGI